MTIKEMFKKIEAYNEVAEIMRTDKARLSFTYDSHWGEKFDSFQSFRKWIRRELAKEIADFVLSSNEFEMDKEIEFRFTDRFGWNFEVTVGTYLVS